jgi:hypothetical protein
MMDAAEVQNALEGVLRDAYKSENFNPERIEVLNYLIEMIVSGAMEPVLDYDGYYD